MISILENWIQLADKWGDFEFVLTSKKLFITCL